MLIYLLTWATKLETSPTLPGTIKVLLVFASLLKARMYCSAIVRAAALCPWAEHKEVATTCNPFARACATASKAWASPVALLICSCLSASNHEKIKFLLKYRSIIIWKLFDLNYLNIRYFENFLSVLGQCGCLRTMWMLMDRKRSSILFLKLIVLQIVSHNIFMQIRQNIKKGIHTGSIFFGRFQRN